MSQDFIPHGKLLDWPVAPFFRQDHCASRKTGRSADNDVGAAGFRPYLFFDGAANSVIADVACVGSNSVSVKVVSVDNFEASVNKPLVEAARARVQGNDA
jgi:hypothetical protein